MRILSFRNASASAERHDICSSQTNITNRTKNHDGTTRASEGEERREDLGEETKEIKGRKGRRVKGHDLHSSREDAFVDTIIQCPWVRKDS